MRIEVWSDFTCPFCYLGMRNLQAAMNKFPHQDFVRVEFKSFQLAPDAEYNLVGTMEALLTERYGLTSKNIKLMIKDIVKHAQLVNLNIQLDEIKTTNTFLAHRLTKYAKKQNKERELMEVLFKGYFNKATNLADKQTLILLAEQVGLDKCKVEQFLSLNACTKAVEEDEAVAEEIGINDVPFIIFNEEQAVAGFRTEATFTEILYQLWENDPSCRELKKEKVGSYCTGTECER